MEKIPEYSNDIWDYLDDIYYMPSRQERDQLLEKGDSKHLQIWDFFFRIRPEYVGKPQKMEISEINNKIYRGAEKKKEIIETANSRIKTYEDSLKTLRTRRVTIAAIPIGLGILSFIFLGSMNSINDFLFSVTYCGGPFWFIGAIILFTIPFSFSSDKYEIAKLKNHIETEQLNYENFVEDAKKRISFLENSISELIQQIPSRPSNKTIQKWFEEDVKLIEAGSLNSSGLGTRLREIRLDVEGQTVRAPNPIQIMGPGELQDPRNIPQTFKRKINPDRAKHLHARRAIYLDNEPIVLYGVYYIEHILIADDMLATCGRFFDFISGMSHSESVTEQYYKDVVSIKTTREFRQISLEEDNQDLIIENAPTFKLSLASGEERTVTFVNQDYFNGISKKLEIEQDQVEHIRWAKEAPQIADNAIKVLRFYLRKHKGVNNVEES